MRVFVCLGLFTLCTAFPAAAQLSCSPEQETAANRNVRSQLRSLREQPVPKSRSVITPELSAALLSWKQALATASQAAFACSPGSISPEQVQTRLAAALQANQPTEADARSGNEYGSGLSAQVFELNGKPRIFEVDLRYEIPCGDDHLLLVFQAPDATSSSHWQQQLRWDASRYTSVGDAFGDFVLLTPLTGSHERPSWRYLVAHGQPSCEAAPHLGTFDLDLLRPSSNPAHPVVDWHFADRYTAGAVSPRLATTESTVDLRLTPASNETSQPAAGQAQYRFHLNANGQLERLPANVEGAPGQVTPSPAASPQ